MWICGSNKNTVALGRVVSASALEQTLRVWHIAIWLPHRLQRIRCDNNFRFPCGVCKTNNKLKLHSAMPMSRAHVTHTLIRRTNLNVIVYDRRCCTGCLFWTVASAKMFCCSTTKLRNAARKNKHIRSEMQRRRRKKKHGLGRSFSL